jgi:class 3 adenylate cyclase
MGPEVRYCTTTDAVRIAYTVTGTGPPLVFAMEPVVSHVQLEWAHPVFGRLMAELTRHNTLIRYDTRGSGASDRVQPSSVEHLLLDLEAVLARVGLDAFALAAVQALSPLALTFAARHRDRVKRLVLVDGFARLADLLGTKVVRGLIALGAADFVTATEAIGAIAFGVGRDESRDHGRFIRSCIDQENIANAEVLAAIDASREAAAVTAPTLIIHHRHLQYVTDAMVRELAALMPNAQLAVIDGLWADEPAGMALRIADFVNGDEMNRASGRPEPAQAARPVTSGTAIILFADVVDSTAITARIGNEAFRERTRQLEDALRTVIRDAGGFPVEGRTLGDGVLGVFTSAAQAIAAALRCGQHADRVGLQLHLGIHAGDVLRESGGRVSGIAVSMASRISALTAPNEILVSATVRDLARASTGVTFEDRGEQALKGIGDAIRVFAVRLQA